MVFFVLILHLATLILSLWLFWEAISLYSGRSTKQLALYKKVSAQKMTSLAKNHAWLLVVLGLWFLAVFIGVLLFRIPFSSWAILYLVGSAIFFIGKRIIENRHGIEHA